MNYKKREKAVNDFSMFEGSEEELKLALKDAKYSDDEIDEIIVTINVTKGSSEEKKDAPKVEKIPALRLYETEQEDGQTVFSKCENWDKYTEQASKYNGTKNTDYLKVNAVGCFRSKLNSKAQPVKEMVGLKLVKEKPLHKTRITPEQANLLNAQIWNTSNLPDGSIYYLLSDLIEF